MKSLLLFACTLFLSLVLTPNAFAGPCQNPDDSCITSFSISPSAILGDQFHEAIATVSMHVAPNFYGLMELLIPETTGVQHATCLSGWLTIVGELGYTVGCSNRGISGGSGGTETTVLIALVGYNYTSTVAQGTITAQAMYFLGEPTKTATIEVDPVTTFTETPDQDPDLPCADCGYGGAPINFTNGNTWITQQDYSIPGLGGGLNLTRTWNSLWPLKQPPETLGIFGDSWRSNLEERVQQLSGGVVKYWKGDGSLLFYSWNGSSYVLTAPANDATILTYNSGTQQTTVTLKDGTQKIFNSGGYLTSIVDRNSNTTTISIDAAHQNRIASVTDAAARVVTFNYTNAQFPRLCTSISDSVGTIASYQYDTSGLLKQVAYPDGSQLNFAYTDPNSSTLISSVTDSQSKVIESHTYDAQRRGATSQNANGVNSVSVSYNAGVYNNENYITDSLGNTTALVVGSVAARFYVASTQGFGCATCGFSTNSSYGVTSGGYLNVRTDGNGQNVQYTYDPKGNVLTKFLPDGSSLTGLNGWDQWQYTYNSFSEVLTATDPLNHTTIYQYDTHGNLTSVTTPSPDGIIAASVTMFAYNTNGTLKTITDPLNHVTTITYYPTGLINTIKDTNNKITTYTYDGRGNRLTIQDPVNGSTKLTTFTYSMKRVTSITYPSQTTSVQFHYDWRGRRDWVIDQNSLKTTYGYDDANRLISVTDPQTPTPGVTTYGYDTENNLKDIWDASSNHTHFDYIHNHQLQTTTFPSGYTETYQWDGNDNLNYRTDRNQQQIRYSYTYQNQLVQKDYPDGTQLSYTIDPAGRLTQVVDPTGTYTFAYDNMNRLKSATTDYTFDSAGNLTVQYGYDAASNRTSMTDPQSLATIYGYDVLNRLTSLAFNGQNPAFGFGYDALSRRTSLTRPNSVNTTYAYDAVSRLISILHKLSTTTLDGATYTYDNAFNRKTRTDKRLNTTLTYTYDNIYQLQTAKQGSTTKETYTYDLVGNRLSSLGVSPYTYNSSNELTSLPALTYTYDNNGNTQTKSNGTTYSWDYENRLTQVVLPGTGGTVNFKYDPFGRRAQKSFTQNSTTTTTNYLYDGPRLLEEVDNGGNVLARYTQSRGIDEPLAQLRSTTTSYYQQDGLGSVTSLSNGAGALANTYTYDSYGKLTASTGTLVNPFQYAGRESDAETGIYQNRFRYYDQSAGRFISEDPVGFLGGINKYVYVLNRPTSFNDPFGLQGGCPEYPTDCVHSPGERAQMQREHDEMMRRILGPDSEPNPPSPAPPSNCDHPKSPNGDCTAAWGETGIGIAATVGEVALIWYLAPVFAEEGIEGVADWTHIGPALAPGPLLYLHGIMDITEQCQ